MITDRNEAFMHNSCKKLAQLGKVIFAMSNQIQERQEEALDLQCEYESMIQKVVDEYHEKAESIAKDLVHFRKKRVDESCKEFGSLYKQQKIDLANVKTNYVECLNKIIKEGEDLIKVLKESQSKSLTSATTAIKSADDFMTNVRSHQQRSSTSKREIRLAIQPILDKIDIAQKESDDRIKQMKLDYTKTFSGSKKEIDKFIKQELFNRKDQFQSIKDEIKRIRSDMDLIKIEFANSIKREKEFYKNKHQLRVAIQKETKDACNDITKSMKSNNGSAQKDNKQHQITITNLKNQLQRKKNEHQSQIESLKRQIKEQKRLKHQFTSKVDLELQKRKGALDSATQDQINSQKVQAKKKKNLYKLIASGINECETDTKKLIDIMQKQIDEFLETLKQHQASFHEKILLQEQIAEKRLDEELEVFKQRSSERMAILESAVEAQNAANEEALNKQTKRNCHLRHEIKRNNNAFNEAFEALNEKIRQEYDSAVNFNQNRLSQKNTENDNSMNRRTNEKQKRMEDLLNGFQKDIQAIEDDVKSKNDQIISETRENESQKLSLKEEIKDHEMEVSKMIAKNDFLTKRIIELKDEKIKMEEIYQNEISSYQKAKRQFERKTKVEEQKLDEEFEMKIQIAQVTLNNSIENISKLYEADENQRGCAVIEAIRKVRDVKNRVKEYKITKEHELSNAKREFDKEKSILMAKINDYTGLDKEEELRNKMKQIKENSEEIIKDTHNRLETERSRLNSKIQLSKTKAEIELNEIKVQKNIEDEKFTNKRIDFQNEKKKLEIERDNQISNINEQYNQKIEEINSEHRVSVEKLKNRIESAKKTKQEILDKHNSEIEQTKNNNWDEIKRKQADYDQRKENMFSSDRQRCDNLTEKTDQLSRSQIEEEMKLYDPPIRSYEQKLIDSIKNRIQNSDEKLQNIFETFYTTIHDAPNNVHDEDSLLTSISDPLQSMSSLSSSSQQGAPSSSLSNRPSTAATPSIKKNHKISHNFSVNNANNNANNNIGNNTIKNIKSSRKEKGPRVMTPNMAQDTKLKKRPQLVSPQFM
ncbi:hypothetical protein M9Y10_022574 [Tritrichomonas musculus]|uniref:Uncharacterized protein n=1 Tax=Tritrichomonas musculus TaxID=1915356 RepID=A0ABR2KTM4_9EUKA